MKEAIMARKRVLLYDGGTIYNQGKIMRGIEPMSMYLGSYPLFGVQSLETDYIETSFVTSTYKSSGYVSSEKIDLSLYTALKAEYTVVSASPSGDIGVYLVTGPNKTETFGVGRTGWIGDTSRATGLRYLTLNIASISVLNHVWFGGAVGVNAGALNIKWHKVWLE